MTKRIAAAVCFSIVFYSLSIPAAGALELSDFSGKKQTYALIIDGKISGYMEESLEGPVSEEGLKLFIQKSFTVAKLSLLGHPYDLEKTEEYRFRSDTLDPLSYTQVSKAGGSERRLACDFEGKLVHITIHTGEEEVYKDVIEIPEGTLLIYHHALLGKIWNESATKPVRFPLFIPDVRKTFNAELDRKGEEVELEAAGGIYAVDAYTLRVPELGSQIEIMLESGTNDLISVYDPVQRLKITVAEDVILEHLQRAGGDGEKVLPVDLYIREFTDIESMRVKADLMIQGQSPSLESLSDRRQKFSGDIEPGSINGVFETALIPYNGKNAPRYPLSRRIRKEMASYLEAEPLVESNDPQIRRLARNIARGSRNAWEASVRLAGWVHKNIRHEITEERTAEETLKRKKGDCGSRTLLHIAFSRAAGIPARGVVGIYYSTAFGGSFGQHAWSEVYMGDDGWIPVDASVGETSRFDAGHIKLGSGARIKSVEILDYRPKTGKGTPLTPVKPAVRSELPWKAGERYTYDFKYKGSSIGTHSFTIDPDYVLEGKRTLRMDGEIHLEQEGLAVHMKGRTIYDKDLTPLRFDFSGTVDEREVGMECRMEKGKARVKITQADSTFERQVDIPEGCLLFDNNWMCHFAVMSLMVNQEKGCATRLNTFHPTSMKVLPLTFEVEDKVEIAHHEKEVKAILCRVEEIRQNIWFTEEGKLLRVIQGPYFMELQQH